MRDIDFDKATAQIIVEIVEYVPDSISSKTIFNKTTGHVKVVSLDSGSSMLEKSSPFETFIQIIEGNAEIIINRKSHHLTTGHGIVVPAHLPNTIIAHERFKMIVTIIKSGYED